MAKVWRQKVSQSGWCGAWRYTRRRGEGPPDAVDATSARVARYPSVENGFGDGLAVVALALSSVDDDEDDEDIEAVRYVRNSATKSRAARSDAVEDVRPSYGPGGKASCDILRRG